METLSLAITEVNVKEAFDYTTHFTNENLAKLAKVTTGYFKSFVRQTFQGLIETGKLLWEFYENCCGELGAEPGRKAFSEWLTSEQFGSSRYLADAAMALFPWYKNLPKALQRLVATQVDTWSISALKELPKLTYDLIEKLITEGKQTAKSIRCAWEINQGKRYLILGELATEADWQLISEKYEIVGDNLESLRLEAQVNATLNTDTGLLEVTTDALVKALKTFDYNPNLVLPKAKSQKRYTEEEVEQIRQEITASKTVEITQIIEAKEREIQEIKVAQSQFESVLAEQQKTFEQLQQQLQIQYQTEVEELKQESSQKAILESENAYLRERIAQLENSRTISESEGISQEIISESEQQLADQESPFELLSPQVEQFNWLKPTLSNQPLHQNGSIQVISETQSRESERLERENQSLKQQIKELKNQLGIYEINHLNRNSKSVQKRRKAQGFAIK